MAEAVVSENAGSKGGVCSQSDCAPGPRPGRERAGHQAGRSLVLEAGAPRTATAAVVAILCSEDRGDGAICGCRRSGCDDGDVAVGDGSSRSSSSPSLADLVRRPAIEGDQAIARRRGKGRYGMSDKQRRAIALCLVDRSDLSWVRRHVRSPGSPVGGAKAIVARPVPREATSSDRSGNRAAACRRAICASAEPSYATTTGRPSAVLTRGSPRRRAGSRWPLRRHAEGRAPGCLHTPSPCARPRPA